MSKIQEALEKIHDKDGTGGQHAKGSQRREMRDGVADVRKMADESTRDTRQLDKLKIIYPEMSDTGAFNAFRDLRTSLRRAVVEKNPAIMVTSVCAGGGGSLVALNLARAIALDDGVTSLLIDCNLQKSSLFDGLAIDDKPLGLREYMKDESLVAEDIIHSCGISRLRVIPVGQKSIGVTEFFTSSRLGQLVREVKNRYSERNIIIDSPPICETADARLLAEICDYVLLVVPYGKATRAKIQKSVDAIGQDKLVGVVFNNEPGLLV
ncbi:hypothetical protein MNBD_GAMMA15-627 [hydrothermal vent metagenome]|uniref:Polysaccharide biosynthesis protein n=1 Tax=hydrothermal vent metagenome TaxID=652676 RepID=A0A3B0XXU0_9ZZZZ